MKKLTAGIFATLLTVVTVGVANADIASTAWVNSKIGEVNTGVDSKIEGVQQAVNAEIAELDGQVVGLASEVENKLDTATASQTYATKTALNAKADKATTLAGYGITDGATKTELTSGLANKLDSTTASQTYATKTELEDYATTEELTSGLANKLDSTTASQTYATKTALNAKADASALANKLDKNLGAGKSGQILTVGADGAITSSATIAQGKVDGLTAKLDAKADASALTALETEVEGKQNKLTTTQLDAVNSGITATKVSTYDGYNSKITTATNTATAAKTAADAATEAAETATSTATAAKTAADAATEAAEKATSTATAAKTAADAATEAAESAASSASSAATSASKAIPKPADTTVNSTGTFVLTYTIGTGYAWEPIER